jgi:hypothetical protein
MFKFNRVISSIAFVGAIASASVPAYAGGLFGDGGVFRGTVGNWLDQHVEQPITTPLAQGAAVVGGAAVGDYYGGPAGGAAGACAGQMVNQEFAGQGPGNCMGQVAQNVVMGNICYTANGPSDPGPAQPVGSGCFINTPWGSLQGQVGQ